MVADDLSQRLERIREDILREATNSARDASTDYNVGRFNYIEHSLIPDIKQKIHDLDKRSVELKDILRDQEDNVEIIPDLVDKTINKKIKNIILWPALATFIVVLGFIISLFTHEDLQNGLGKAIFTAGNFNQIISEEIDVENDITSKNILNSAILKVVANAIEDGTVTHRNNTLLNEQSIREPELVIALKRFISIRKNEFKLFETPRIAESVNVHQDKLRIFDKRVSIAYAFSKELNIQEYSYSIATLHLPVLRNELNINCVYEFSIYSKIPESITFKFENENDSHHTATVPDDVPNERNFFVDDFKIEHKDLPERIRNPSDGRA